MIEQSRIEYKSGKTMNTVEILKSLSYLRSEGGCSNNSVITECEVFSGLKSAYRLQGIKLFNSRRCIEVSSSVARLTGDIRREQRTKGRKLKTPDAILIATSIEHQLGLVSRDHDMSFVREASDLPLFTI